VSEIQAEELLKKFGNVRKAIEGKIFK
jgi:hypothetical protein